MFKNYNRNPIYDETKRIITRILLSNLQRKMRSVFNKNSRQAKLIDHVIVTLKNAIKLN